MMPVAELPQHSANSLRAAHGSNVGHMMILAADKHRCSCEIQVEADEYNLINMQELTRQMTAIIWREEADYVALCPELDIATEGHTVEKARMNLIEALELFFEAADEAEIVRRLHPEVFVTKVEIAVPEP